MSGIVGAGEAVDILKALKHELKVLEALAPHVTGVGQSAYNGAALNKMDVHCRITYDGKKEYIRRSGSAVFDDKLKMALEVRRRVTAILGAAAVDLAEEAVRAIKAAGDAAAAPAAPESTLSDLEWIRC